MLTRQGTEWIQEPYSRPFSFHIIYYIMDFERDIWIGLKRNRVDPPLPTNVVDTQITNLVGHSIKTSVNTQLETGSNFGIIYSLLYQQLTLNKNSVPPLSAHTDNTVRPQLRYNHTPKGGRGGVVFSAAHDCSYIICKSFDIISHY